MHSVEVLSNVSNWEGCDVTYEEKNMLEKLHSDMSYSAVGCELNVNEPPLYIK